MPFNDFIKIIFTFIKPTYPSELKLFQVKLRITILIKYLCGILQYLIQKIFHQWMLEEFTEFIVSLSLKVCLWLDESS